MSAAPFLLENRLPRRVNARESLDRLLALPLEEGALLILTHDNPDPDCIASASALRYLLQKKRGIRATVGYSGIIGRAENRTMVELLDLELTPVTELSFDDFRYLALIDAQPRTGNTAIPADRTVDIVIDHHPLRDYTRTVPFHEVRDGVGATATMLTQYLRAARLRIPKNLATALVYGIRSETQDLGREVSHEDLDAYEYLLPVADPSLLAAIAKPRLPRRYFAHLAAALTAAEIAGRTVLCSMDTVSDPDFVPEMADLIVRMHDARWALATGVFEDRLYVSIRTAEADAAAGEMMQTILMGIGSGGGHGMRAGGNVDLVQVARPHEGVAAELRRRFLELTGDADAPVERLIAGDAGR